MAHILTGHVWFLPPEVIWVAQENFMCTATCGELSLVLHLFFLLVSRDYISFLNYFTKTTLVWEMKVCVE
jgi:hypothetical protein